MEQNTIIGLVIGAVLIVAALYYYFIYSAVASISSGLGDLFIPPGSQYIFHQGKDSWGSDIVHIPELADNIPALKAKCDELPNCKGFTTTGWFKHTIQPENKWSTDSARDRGNQGMYIKQ